MTLTKISMKLIKTKQPSSLFMLFSQQWFIAMWNDLPLDEMTPDESGDEEESEPVPLRCKEEVCLYLLEASLKVKEQMLDTDTWLLQSVETAEICSKVLDWKIKQSQMGEQVCMQYLLYLEDIILTLEKKLLAGGESEVYRDYRRKVQG